MKNYSPSNFKSAERLRNSIILNPQNKHSNVLGVARFKETASYKFL